MDFKEKAKMSLEDFRLYIDDDDFEFAYGTIDFLSTKPNSHLHVYSEEVIREYAPSILGKWVIGEYKNGDMSSHTMNQVIQGRIPENQEVQYRYDEDGYLIASVDIVLSKLYSSAYNVLKEDNFRNVSIEELLGFTPETEDIINGTAEKIVEGFHVCAVTILGKTVNGSIPNANIQLTKMSEDNAKDIELEYAKYSEVVKDLKDDDKMSVILNKLEEISSKLEKNKEETMEEKIEVTETVENTEIVEEVETVENAEVEEVKAEEQPESIEEPEDEKMACGDIEKMAELETKLADAEAKLATYEAQLEELKEFKDGVEVAKCQEIVKSTLDVAKKVVDESKYDEFVKQSEVCVYSTVEAWSDKVLASISKMAIAKMEEINAREKEDGILDIGMPITTTNKKESIYD